MAVEIRNGDHAMLRRAGLWHSVAAEFVCSVLRLPGRGGELTEVIRTTATDRNRVVL
jgi:hypothetical protein